MSIILAVATSDIAILKCDGRMRGPDNEIIDEKRKKFNIINEHFVVGFTGNSGFVSAVLDKTLEMGRILGYDLKMLSVNSFAPILQKVLVENENLIKQNAVIKAGFVLIGLEDNKIIMKAISTGDGLEIIDYTPLENGSIKYLSLVSDRASRAKGFPEFYTKSESLTTNMDNFIRYIATLDDSVNTNITTFLLKRK